MLESGIVAHCAPTLAGIKTANMFNYLPDDMEDLPREIQEENRKLNGKGVYVEILRTSLNMCGGVRQQAVTVSVVP